MKKIFYLAAAVMMITLASCGGNKSAEQQTVGDTLVVNTDQAMYLEDILDSASAYVDKEIVIRGIVDHTCSHSGRRCFLLGKDPSLTIRVEAKGNIGGFNRELSGSEIAVRGTLREKFISEEEIKAMEQQLAEKVEKEGADHCDSEAKAIQSMRKWMKDNNREAFSEYYVDGTDFEVMD